MIRLHVGMPRSMRVVWLGCLVPLIALANLMLGALGWMFLTSSEVPGVGAFFLLMLLLIDVLVVLTLALQYRNAYWLDGRVLVRRLLFGRRTYDLRAAHVAAETATPVWTNWRGGVLPRLVVRAPGTAPARIWLRDPSRGGALLPPDQLAALARAIDPDLRHPVARRLWELASDPLRGVV
ncbi:MULTISPECIES: hypothetical protein [Thermomonosporaceae]|uniref:PH domain-containing protein n=1 Tax=Actinomadura livida TaxID=79909 RepID=A0A7W7IH65_9ACTN|nr:MULTISPECIES: hypothetical protein [Actinomadura]MBB4777047.1 hypothetical protein [Actinomadura catellatispora]GGU36931.1 hypothetical protein GCM10010208_71750 [Actinomadura livida]